MSDKRRADPKEAVERVVHDLHKLTADGFVVERFSVTYDLERTSKHGAKIEVGARVVIDLTPIA